MKKTDAIRDELFPRFIQAYRKNILIRYGEENLSRYPEFQVLSREKKEQLIRYFLELLYPEWENRIQLDLAFQSLKGFVFSPAKVFGLIGSLGLSIWKMGRYLPEAFRAGIAALSSYVTAHEMEQRLLEEGRRLTQEGKSMEEETTFQSMIAVIPRTEAEEFRRDVVALFRTLTNEELVDRILWIMDRILQKMQEKSNLYSKEEMEAIALGISILKQGKKILENLSESEKKLMLTAIDRIERDYYEFCLSLFSPIGRSIKSPERK